MELIGGLLSIINQILNAGIVMVAASMLLYNLSRSRDDQITRTSSILLSAVTVVYFGDVIISIGINGARSLNAWLRFQWIGIALVPAAMFHLSHVLLSTTGRLSRWRRRLGTGIFYTLAIAFILAAAFTDRLIHDPQFLPVPRVEAGPMFPVFVCYAVLASALALYNVVRARLRCLTPFTRRRMSFMLYAILTPIIGVFPYTALVQDIATGTGTFWLLVTLGNIGMILMLSFMAYPLSFFSSEVPDRMVKSELLRFFLRGPFVGIALLVMIIGLPQAGRVFGIPGAELMPLASVAVLILLEWLVDKLLPFLEDRLIYVNDRAAISHLRRLNARLLARADFDQLLEGILASACDYLQVNTAFAVSLTADGPVLEQTVGDGSRVRKILSENSLEGELNQLEPPDSESWSASDPVTWESFWLVPLWNRAKRNQQNGDDSNRLLLFGVMAVQARDTDLVLSDEESHVMMQLADRAARTLLDMRVQAEVFGYLESLIPEMEDIDQLRWITRYRGEPGEVAESIVAQPGFETKVKQALSHYWGGPKLTESELLGLRVVQGRLEEHDGNAVNALRAVIVEAVERLRPEGERSMTANEWMLYNILEMRFIQGRKVRDVARRLAMSESDLYRKQRIALGELARTLTEMEHKSALLTEGNFVRIP